MLVSDDNYIMPRPKKGRAIVNGQQAIYTNQNQNSMKQAVLNSAIVRTNAPDVATTNLKGTANNPYRQSIIVPQSNMIMRDDAEQASANVYPVPPSFTITVASATGAGAANTRVYIINQSGTPFNNVTNNGSGAGSITYSYQDGFSGAVLDRILGYGRGGVGILCLGLSLRMVLTSTKAGDPTGLASSNPRFEVYNAYGSVIPTNFNFSADQTRGDFDTSIEIATCVQNITAFTQFSFVMPLGDTATVTFYTTPNFSR